MPAKTKKIDPHAGWVPPDFTKPVPRPNSLLSRDRWAPGGVLNPTLWEKLLDRAIRSQGAKAQTRWVEGRDQGFQYCPGRHLGEVLGRDAWPDKGFGNTVPAIIWRPIAVGPRGREVIGQWFGRTTVWVFDDAPELTPDEFASLTGFNRSPEPPQASPAVIAAGLPFLSQPPHREPSSGLPPHPGLSGDPVWTRDEHGRYVSRDPGYGSRMIAEYRRRVEAGEIED